jgi:AraC-like DNA-binding protein
MVLRQPCVAPHDGRPIEFFAADAGFPSSARFGRAFHAVTGMTPSDPRYRPRYYRPRYRTPFGG